MDSRTRGSHKFSISNSSHSARRNFFTNRVIASWNKLPNQGLREVKSELEFKHLISVVSNVTTL